MFFVASKSLSWLLQPESWLLLLIGVGLWSLRARRLRVAAYCIGVAAALIVVVFYSPAGAVLLRPLEHRVDPPARLPQRVDGFIVLSGALNAPLTRIYAKPQMGEDAERLTELIALARLYPEAKVIYSGGSAALLAGEVPETEAMRLFLEEQGFPLGRVTFEAESRDTYENAVYSKRLARPAPGETWVLITSAFHMPRAYGVFRKIGWSVVPYPVSYRTRPAFSIDERGYTLFSLAVHEWAGLALYALTGRL